MNNYSWMQQKLHQYALSSKFMREAAFDLESLTTKPIRHNDNHVFISGIARSGTTILLNAIYKSNEFASLSYKDMPFVLAPNLWSKLSLFKKDLDLIERAHGDGIEVSKESPEAFEEVFWMTFHDSRNSINEMFRTYVSLINHKYQKYRYLSKNNQNIKRIEVISRIFPNSKILIPFREPLQQAYSLLYQHKRFINNSNQNKFISNYMKWIGHTEFGPNYIPMYQNGINYKDDLNINHWIEQWYLSYKSSMDSFKDKKNIHFICYEKLCESNEYWLNTLKILDIKEKYSFPFKTSIKEISLDYDYELNDKASLIYSELSKYT